MWARLSMKWIGLWFGCHLNMGWTRVQCGVGCVLGFGIGWVECKLSWVGFGLGWIGLDTCLVW